MPQPIDFEELMRKNPHLDPAQLAEQRKLAEALRHFGRRRRRDRLALPFAGRRARIVDDLDSDPRVTRLCDLKE